MASTAVVVAADGTTSPAAARRESLNGSWMLDKTRGEWSMRHYLAVMDVDPLAIEAHEKGEIEADTIHTIELTDQRFKVVKRSRVNNDLVVELTLGMEQTQLLPPGNRFKKSTARSNHPGHVEIISSIQTVNGTACVIDTKLLVQEEAGTILQQTLAITNENSHKTCSTVRIFKPIEDHGD